MKKVKKSATKSNYEGVLRAKKWANEEKMHNIKSRSSILNEIVKQ